MSKNREKYTDEVLKQLHPYDYYIKNVEEEIKGEEFAPFICIEDNDEYKKYDAGEFYLYESVNGSSTDAEKGYLVLEGKKLNADLIYSDADCISKEGKRFAPFFKPDWSPDLYDSYDYISEFYAVKKQFDNTPLHTINKISHVTKTLFHRFSDKTECETYDFILKNIKRPDYSSLINKTCDSISIVIPSKDNPDMLARCLDGLRRAKIKSGINEIQLCLVDNGSNEENKKRIESILSDFAELNPLYIYEVMDFNFSGMCNKGAESTSGEYILFLNDDIEVIDEDFLVKLLYYAKKDYVGAVGAKLLYPDGKTIQHVGLTDLKYCGPSHKLSTFNDEKVLYYGKNRVNLDSIAVTGACLMISREKYFLINGFHDKMKIGYNDVDLCLSLYEKGFYNVLVNDTCLIHHESVSRGSDLSAEKHNRLKAERNLLYERHSWLREKGDPFYNVNLAGDFLDYRVNVIPDFERRDLTSTLHPELVKAAKKLRNRYKTASSRNSFCNIEGESYVRALFQEENYLAVTGWGVVNKKDNADIDVFLCVFSEGDKTEVYEAMPVYREDVSKIFQEARNSLLSGFTVKIPMDEAEKEKDREYGVMFVSKHFGNKYYAGFNKSDI